VTQVVSERAPVELDPVSERYLERSQSVDPESVDPVDIVVPEYERAADTIA
jgi:hypothetical protein